MNRNYSLGSASVGDSSPIAESAGLGLVWLLGQQNADDGSWGDRIPLDQLISTCHACLTLLVAGIPLTSPALSNGITYLRSDAVANHSSGYWRIAPLAGVPGASIEVEQSLEQLRWMVGGHAAPSPDQQMAVFLVKTLGYLGRWDEAVRYEPIVVSRFDPEQAWSGRADSTSHALAVLMDLAQHGGVGLTGEMVTIGTRLIIESAAPGGGPEYTSWVGRVTSTAYTLINIIESPLWENQRLQQRCRRAANWIRTKQTIDGYWPVEDPPYGGATEITSPCYYTAVAIRGLIAYGSMVNPAFLIEVEEVVNRVRDVDIARREQALKQQAEVSRVAAESARVAAIRWRAATIAMAACVTGVALFHYRKSLADTGKVVLVFFAVVGGIAAIMQLIEYFGRVRNRRREHNSLRPQSSSARDATISDNVTFGASL